MPDIHPELQYRQTNHFAPPGMIPEFNELGNHPDDMYGYVQEHVGAAYDRLGLGEAYDEAEAVYFAAIADLSSRSSTFAGRYLPNDSTSPVFEHFSRTFVNTADCHVDGYENYAQALELTAAGHNVILAPNHTSPLDGLVPFTLFTQDFPGAQRPAIVMSQVFEYARITRLITSGIEKFPVFQPKHIRRFVANGQEDTAAEMQRQNVATMKSLRSEAKEGGKQIFLYLERDRNGEQMGVPEPAVSRVLEMLDRARGGTYILPMHICGIDSIFPNRPGHNEMDEFFETVQVGSGNVSYGRPVLFSRIVEEVEATDPAKLTEVTLGSEAAAQLDSPQTRLAAIAVATLGLVALQAPSHTARGLYGNAMVTEIADRLQAA
jgi:hypothetical protein